MDERPKLLILYATQTGNALDVAEQVGREAERRGCPVKLLSLDEYDNVSQSSTSFYFLPQFGFREYAFFFLNLLNNLNILMNMTEAVLGLLNCMEIFCLLAFCVLILSVPYLVKALSFLLFLPQARAILLIP